MENWRQDGARARGERSAAALAQALLNTRTLPAGLANVKGYATEALAYHSQDPYPLFAFRAWKTEDRGPLPFCLPIAKGIVKRSARWLFGKPLTLTCPDAQQFEQLIRKAWRENRMPARLRAMAEKAALEGGIVLKFDYDGSRPTRKLSIQSLSLVHQVRLFYHPHDRDQLLMARVQYPYQEGGATYWYREEWTAAELVVYNPVRADELGRHDPDKYEGWVPATKELNRFGVIPLVHIRNLETDDAWGAGDLWDPRDPAPCGLFRIIDRINLTYHLMDRSNQFDSGINPIYIDLDISDEDVGKPLQPGEGMAAETVEGAQSQGRVEFPPSGNSLRPAMMEFCKDLRKQVHAAASSVEVDSAEITNKGNLTQAVLTQLYAPLIELTEEKRTTWGDDGLCRFFAVVAEGLRNLGVREVDVTPGEEDEAVILGWPRFIELSDDEKTVRTTRIQMQERAGYVTRDRAIDEISALEDRDDVETLKEELEKQPEPDPASEPDPAAGGDEEQDDDA